MSGPYDEAYSRSINDPEGFWGDVAEDIDWIKKWDKVLDDSNKPFYRWFAGGVVNTCYNALDRHVDAGHGDRLALIYDSPVTGNTVRKYTFSELRDEVAKFAGVLAAQGVGKGDRVIVYMPMVAEAAIAMLACARIGAVHSVVFGGFAANELAVRINDAKPKVIVSASCGIEGAKIIEYKPLIDGAIELSASKPEKTIILQRPQARCELKPGFDIDWAEAVASAQPADCVPVAATDPLYILYTSGTTGEPKGVVRDNGGHLVALNWTMKNIYNVDPGEVFWAASDVGWVVGHSYIVYAPLIHGCTTIVYEGKPVGTPDAGAFWRVIADHGVKALFTAPTAFRAIKREDPNAKLMGNYDLSKFETLFLAGERTDPDTLDGVRFYDDGTGTSATVMWNGVAQFGGSYPNTFQAQFFSDGSIQFNYIDLDVNPDDDPNFSSEDNVIIGVSAGNGATANEVDLDTAVGQSSVGGVFYEFFDAFVEGPYRGRPSRQNATVEIVASSLPVLGTNFEVDVIDSTGSAVAVVYYFGFPTGLFIPSIPLGPVIPALAGCELLNDIVTPGAVLGGNTGTPGTPTPVISIPNLPILLGVEGLVVSGIVINTTLSPALFPTNEIVTVLGV